tara:strand:+ start:14265 stop:16922 length:2658 start_codon:yes stop_codon:yes gene_type:complete
MTDFLKGNTPATIYKRLLSVGGAADHAGLTSSLKAIFTDDGAGSSNASSIKLSTTALRMESSNQLRFRDDAIYIYSSGDTILNLVADGEIDLATATIDINATTTCTIDNTNTSNGVAINTATSGSPVSIGHSTSETTVNDNLTVTGTTAHTGVVTMASGVKLQFVDGNEYLSGDSTNLTLGSSADINLTATSDVNVPANVGLTFGDDGEKIEGDGTNLAVVSSGALNLTGASNSTWKTTSGGINIDSEASTVEVDGNSGVTIQGNAATILIESSGAVDINSGSFTLDGTDLSIDGTDDSNVTVTGSGKDLTLSVAGGGTQQLIMSSAGTASNAVVIESTAGGIDILASGAAGDEDIDIVATGSSVNISSSEDVANAIVLNASAGGIDITAGSAEDIDITGSGGVNITSTENAAGSITLHANGGTSETIKIHADQSTSANSIRILSDLGGISLQCGKTGGITNMASDSSSDVSAASVRLATETADVDIVIGHTTSDVLIQDNLKVGGDLHVVGSQAYGALTISHASDTVLTMDNQEQSDADGARHNTIKFTGEKGSGVSVDDMAQIVVAHDGSSADEKGYIDFRTNEGSQGTSPSSALKLSADNTATFSGALTVGSNTITCGRVDADNVRLDVNTIYTTSSNTDLGISPNGTGGIMALNTNAPGDYSIGLGNGANASGSYAFAAGRSAVASGDDSVSIGDSNTASAANAMAIGDGCTASAANAIAIGKANTASNSNSVALGINNLSDRKAEISFASGRNASAGDTRASFFHDFDRHAISSSWQNIDSKQGGITLPSDGVACGTTWIVGSSTGAALTIGFKIDWLAENDGGTYAIIQQNKTALDSEDTSIDAQMAISSDKIVAQVTDAAITTTMAWSVSTHLVQHNF